LDRLSDIDTYHTVVSEHISQSELAFSQINNNLTDHDNRITVLESWKATFGDFNATSLLEAITALETRCAVTENTVSTLNITVQNAITDIETLNTNVTAIRNSIGNIVTTVSSHTANINTLNEWKLIVDATLENKTSVFVTEGVINRVDALEAWKNSLGEITGVDDALLERIATLEANDITISTNINSINSEQRAQNTNISNLNDSMTGVISRLDQSDIVLDNHNTQLTELNRSQTIQNSQIAALASRLDQSDIVLDRHNTQLVELGESQTTQDDQIAALTTKLDNLSIPDSNSFATKDHIHDWTINTKAITSNPVLDGNDIQLTGYTYTLPEGLIETDRVFVATDTINEAFVKTEHMYNYFTTAISKFGVEVYENKERIIVLETKVASLEGSGDVDLGPLTARVTTNEEHIAILQEELLGVVQTTNEIDAMV
jgi:uncharacterized coiled-coil protein SlyX